MPRPRLISAQSTVSRPATTRPRPVTAATSSSYGYSGNHIICAISESQGLSPSIGLAFVNLSTAEAVLCQFTDTQMYARTRHKIKAFDPSEIIYADTTADSNLISTIRADVEAEKYNVSTTAVDRRYWSDEGGQEYVQQLALEDDQAALQLSLIGKYYAVCCFCAALRFVDMGLGHIFARHSLRIKFEASEEAMLIDLSTIANLELVQNLQDSQSKDCLLGVLNNTLTRMGTRLLKNTLLQPSNDRTKIGQRWAAVDELSQKEEIFLALRRGLKSCVDTDQTLANLVVLPKQSDFTHSEQSVNHVLMLKRLVDAIEPIWQALAGVESYPLQAIRVSGNNDFLDVARQSYRELVNEVEALVEQLRNHYALNLNLKYDNSRQFYIKIKVSEVEPGQVLPEIFVNVFRHGKVIECQTLEMVKLNQKIVDAHDKVIAISDSSIQSLIARVRTRIQPLFKISDALALLDLLSSFANLAITQDYVHPEISSDTLAIRLGRHPILEQVQRHKFIPNDVYATRLQKRFQIVTGCNMSGKSSYIRSIALQSVMCQMGSFVPAEYASFPMINQLFARVSTDDCMDGNVSTFAAEMREIAFILRNIEPQSLVIIDELGRGTSTTDGLAIAIAIAEALIQSGAYVFFVTHFRDLPRILCERLGVYVLHMNVEITPDCHRMKMQYKISEGPEDQKYYGLALAQIVDLPAQVMDVAVQVSKHLNERNNSQKRNVKQIALARKRKLTVHLKETLVQAVEGVLEREELLDQLKALQTEFLVRFAAIEADVRGRQVEEEEAEEEESEDGVEIPGSMPAVPYLDSDVLISERVRSESEIIGGTGAGTGEMSWEESIAHENPLFRPMPTQVQVDRNANERRAVWAKFGNVAEDPIEIEDDGGSVASTQHD